MSPVPRPEHERFWEKVLIDEGCWLWQGGRDQDGYGEFGFIRGRSGGLSGRAHRFAYQDMVGPIPKGKWILHTCDNPPCVRPSHLYVGTHQRNCDDKSNRYRVDGERNPHAKLTEQDVRAIRAAAGESISSLSRRFGVTRRHILNIRIGLNWRIVQ